MAKDNKNFSAFFNQVYTLIILYIIITNVCWFLYPIIGFYLSVLISFYYSIVLILKTSQYQHQSVSNWNKLWFIIINQSTFLISFYIYFHFNLPFIKAPLAALLISLSFIFSLRFLLNNIKSKINIKKLLFYCTFIAMLPAVVGSIINSYTWLELAGIEISALIFLYFLTANINQILMNQNVS